MLANDVMRFGEDTHVYGPIHSNNGIRFDGIAHNLVTSSVEDYWDPDTSSTRDGVWTSQADEDAVFLAGKEYPVASVDFGSVITDLALIRDEAQAEGLYLGGDTYEETSCGWVWSGWPPPWWEWQCSTTEVPIDGYHLTLKTNDQVEVLGDVRAVDEATFAKVCFRVMGCVFSVRNEMGPFFWSSENSNHSGRLDRKNHGVEVEVQTNRFENGLQFFGNVTAMRTKRTFSGDWDTDDEIPDIVVGGGASYVFEKCGRGLPGV